METMKTIYRCSICGKIVYDNAALYNHVKRGRIHEIMNNVKNELGKNPATVYELMETLGLAKTTVIDALRFLIATNVVRRTWLYETGRVRGRPLTTFELVTS
jgi:predicted ArsR family transcriptional regulator